MKYWIWFLMGLVLSGCNSISTSQPVQPEEAGSQISQTTDEVAASQSSAALNDYGPAPELHNEIWLNTEKPLRLTDLRGQVVLLEMWTFG